MKDINSINKEISDLKDAISKLESSHKDSNNSNNNNNNNEIVSNGASGLNSESLANLHKENQNLKEGQESINNLLENLRKEIDELRNLFNSSISELGKEANNKNNLDEDNKNKSEDNKNNKNDTVTRAEFNELKDKVGIQSKKVNQIELTTNDLKSQVTDLRNETN